MLIKFDFNNMMDKFIGSQGITDAELKAVAPKAAEAFRSFGKMRNWYDGVGGFAIQSGRGR